MIFGLFTLAVAIFISGVSAFYSVTGLTAIFAAAFWPIVIMGSALEIGKITATVWLHKYWDRAGWQFKVYLVPAIVVLMLITSMGTYGYLAKAHMDQNITVGDSAAQVQILDEKIKTEQDNITASKRALQQMDAQVDQMLGRTTDDRGANRAVQIRKNQAKERKSLQADITAAQKTISQLQAERAPIAAESRKIEAEVGPIKYIAALIYGDNPDANLLERAVRWVIILLVFVFDPLALILILAAEQTLIWNREDKRKKKDEDEPAYEADDGPLTDEQIDTIKETSGIDQDQTMGQTLFDTEEEFFAHGREIAKELDETHAYLNKPWTWMKNTDGPHGYVPTAKEEITTSNISPDELYDFIDEGRKEDPIVITRISNPESNLDLTVDQANTDLDNAISLIAEMQTKLDALQAEHDAKHEELQKIKSVDPVTLTDHLGNPIATYYPPAQQVTAPDLSINAELSGNSVTAGFGTVFPKTPAKGDLYLRVDYLQSKL